MDIQGRYNVRSPAVKRLMREACELKDSTEEYWARPLDDNLFEWHFTVRGPPATDFEGGVYHGRIILPTEYPMKPPNIILLTPNGRFEVNKKICLSISGHHPETWQPSWSIRTALLALIAFMPTPGSGTIGSLDYTPEERRKLARRSQQWECQNCGKICEHLSNSTCLPPTKEESNLIKQIALKGEEPSESADGTLRQRRADVATAELVQQGIPAEQMVGSDRSSAASSDSRGMTVLVWFLLVAIAFLIVRRVFLL
ncbi:ubiquitin-conjugating enzyme E2 J1-like [Schistocerca gregaria]|uniref:ubiquitin-conjugating enzyme E2 J1-like n=1 Tax=Schistocerca gregaria TaxID=7010 RepID=UPI00211DB15D|nr:ubiquitin-conjugating enzyme E2 J1-like [Schistocerca gregaria]